MAFVTVKKKYQVVIPAAVRRQARIEVGDLLEAKADRGKDRKSTRLNSSHIQKSRMPSSA